MFIHFFVCDSLTFIKNYDQNASKIKIHVIVFVKMSCYVWSSKGILLLCI